MSNWSLTKLFENLDENIEHRLTSARTAFSHPGTKGDTSENVWLSLFNDYLPERYKSCNAHVVDSKGNFSDQIDIVIFDRQYSPFVFQQEGAVIVPAESVYGVFEVKQSLSLDNVKYAQEKVTSVRSLHRTSLPIPYAEGVYPPKPPIPILGGILTLDSDWNPALGQSFLNQLESNLGEGKLDINCVASKGYCTFNKTSKKYSVHADRKATTAFLFKLISLLQFSGTVPMIDIESYSRWIEP